MTVDGKITRGTETDIYRWTSKEDKAFFSSKLEKAKVIIMGRKTFEAAHHQIHRRLTQDHKLRIVLTHTPDKFKRYQVENKLEFSNESPRELIKRLEKAGYAEVLLLGGGKLNASFLKAELVDELYLTIEPQIFGTGKPLIGEMKGNIDLKLIDITQLNEQGTYLFHYIIKY